MSGFNRTSNDSDLSAESTLRQIFIGAVMHAFSGSAFTKATALTGDEAREEYVRETVAEIMQTDDLIDRVPTEFRNPAITRRCRLLPDLFVKNLVDSWEVFVNLADYKDIEVRQIATEIADQTVKETRGRTLRPTLVQ